LLTFSSNISQKITPLLHLEDKIILLKTQMQERDFTFFIFF